MVFQITGPGNYEIFYNYTSPNGCSSSASTVVFVESYQAITFQNLQDAYCTNSQEVNYLDALPSGGVFSGVGILQTNISK